MTPKDEDRQHRAARLASALRQNLQRRKVQARARAAREDGPPHDSAEIVVDKADEGGSRRQR